MRVMVVLAVLAAAGCGKPSSPGPAPATPGTPAAAAAAGWRASLEGASIPDQPAAGVVGGQPFKVDSATLEGGTLELKEGTDFFADREFKVFIFGLDKGVLPENRSWTEKADESYGHPHVHVGHKESADGVPHYDTFMGTYAMRLEFGRESGGKLPGKIWLCVPDEKKSWVAGAFAAEVKGFVLRDGKPDLALDSFEGLEWLLLEKLKGEHPGHELKIEEALGGFIMAASQGRPGAGRNTFRWTLDGASQGWIKATFTKEVSWRLVASWPGTQLPEAHPASPPDPKGAGVETLTWRAAVEMEKFLGGKAALSCNFDAQSKAGVAAVVKAEYLIDQGASAATRRMLFKWADEAWAFERELAEGERFNAATGAVEKR